jgi:hypothetical protein
VNDRVLGQLLQLAAGRPQDAWLPGTDISLGRNAHKTNTPYEIGQALLGDFNFLEGDVRQEADGTIVMAHDRGALDGLSLAEWLDVGMASGRGLKLDIKESRAIMPAVLMAKAAGVPDDRLIINVTATGVPDADVSLAQLRAIRTIYPGAVVNLSPGNASYPPTLMRTLARLAQIVGPPVMFPLRWDLVGPNIVSALRPYGRIAIWNLPLIVPRNIPAATAKLRAMGVDGMIDLNHNDSVSSLVETWLRERFERG